MIQKQSLTFVLPQLWEDPFECNKINKFSQDIDDIYTSLTWLTIYYQTFAQCWSELSESDAMWRIYAYNNRSLRIKINVDDISLLDDVVEVKVTYNDNFEFICKHDYDNFLRAISQKRKAFKHEKEIRLIKHYKFKNSNDWKNHVKAAMVEFNSTEASNIINGLYPDLPIEEQLSNLSKFLNVGKCMETTSNISFAHIPNFIKGVLVHPLAPNWYVRTVEEFCKRNNVKFEGQSTLYKIQNSKIITM